MSLLHDGARTVTLRFVRGEVLKDFPLHFPVVLYRGVWTDGTAYEPGDAVTWGGNLFIATEPSRLKPDMTATSAKAWRLAVKAGRDGKPGKDGPPGPPGKDATWR